jgi:hypothetical protein
MANISFDVIRLFFTKDDGNFIADLQNVSLMSLDESIGKIEVDPKEEVSVVEVFQDVLDKLSDVGFLFVYLAVIQAIYIEMVFCKESMSVPLSSFP